MTLAFRDPSIPDSPIARWDTRWKLAAVLFFAFTTVSLHHPATASAALGAVFAGALLARIRLSVIVGRAALLALGVSLFVLVMPFTHPSGWWPGLVAASVVTMRVTAVGLLALMLLRTAPFHATLAAAAALRCPAILIQITQLAYRYTFMLASESRRLRVALRARAFRIRTNTHTYRTLGHTIGSVLVRGADHSERVSEAMRCRGFHGEYHTLIEFRTRSSDVVGCLSVITFAIGLILADRLGQGAL